MIETQFIKEKNKTIAVIIDYKEYKRLVEIEQDKEDYNNALKVKLTNEKWYSHQDVKNEIGM